MLKFIAIGKKTATEIEAIHKKIMAKLRQDIPGTIEEITKEPIVVKFNTRLKTTAGRATKHGIELNLTLLSDNPDELPQVYAHELAHTLCIRTYPHAKGHGRHWQYFMRMMGFEPLVRHKMDVSKLSKRYTYQCKCDSGVRVTKTVHQRIMDGQGKYGCKRCKTILTPEMLMGYLPVSSER